MFLDNFCFDKLIAPHTTAEFFEEYFEQQPLVIKRNDPKYYEGLLSPKDLDQIFFHWPNDLSVVNAGKDEGRRKSMGVAVRQANVQTVLRSLDEGDSVILDSLDQRHAPLTRLCAMLEVEHAWRYQSNVYITPSNAQGFRTHCDNHNVFILQTSGSKSWRVNQAQCPAKLLLDNERKLEIDENDHLAFDLEQGDCIYIPRGFAHDAVSQHGSSVHITLSPHPPVWRLALAQVMHELVKELPEIEQSLPVGYARRPAEETANELAAWLQRLSSFNLVPATQRMIDQNLEDFRGLFYGALERRLAGEPADPECRYVKNAELITHQELSDEACVVKTPRKTVDFPPLFRRQLEYCLSGRVFKASDIPGMAPDEQMVLLDRLLAEGLVVRAEN